MNLIHPSAIDIDKAFWAFHPLVYAIHNGDTLIYIGRGASFYRVIESMRAKRGQCVQIVPCRSQEEATLMESAWIREYRPPLNYVIPRPDGTLERIRQDWRQKRNQEHPSSAGVTASNID